MRDHINDDHVRSQISEASHNLYKTENANILLFLAHLSKDAIIVGQMLDAAKESYADEAEARLSEDVRFLNELGTGPPDLVYQDEDPNEVREEIFEAQDQVENGDVDVVPEPTEELAPEVIDDDPIIRLGMAFKNLEILGQILKNFPGSLEGETKLEIARQCYGLGFRAITYLFNLIQVHEDALIEQIFNAIKDHHPRFTDTEAQIRARQTLLRMAHIISYSLIKRVSVAVGSSELTQTYNRLFEETGSPSVRLVDTSLALDHTGRFPEHTVKEAAETFENNPLALSILRQLVVQHFYLFPVDFNVKQSICQTIGISYVGLQRKAPTPRMLPRGVRQ